MSKIKEDKSSHNLNDIIKNDIKAPSDLGLLKCVQCGMCTSVCPAAAHTDYNPRDLVKKVLDNEEDIISDDKIWHCFYCYSCHSVCPVNNSPCIINQILRQKAIDKGIAKEHVEPFVAYGETFLEIGIGGMPKKFFFDLNRDIEGYLDIKSEIDKTREELSLGPIQMPKKYIKEVNELLKNSNFQKRLKKLKDDED
ncbi:ferredoxin:CoB-CoM heterodisulfide reductase subunit HdrC [Methanobrevibacter sp. TMH8]|uniref:ferredoxin:CoB-CoM heterodisulfide reductase subunit HdrC n=1 Tax=Methanobrevibacter sp. TMH8 TaxID=2848611 RepID=UPI001CC9A6D8|nr:ferredoxin:CoB-CoM heterodisulfide reductase subunit HdrC [Methanobrevibacter sp. TMH8]